MARVKATPEYCERKGCSKATTYYVRHLGLKREAPLTYACFDHAQWWSTGFYGVRIGSMGKI